ncbi:Cytochrome P450-33C9 [Aphelenchoides bicaudatus]|nr:Cytochrome P450-33C9 [Aphelenchoides bicaudatus]
MFVYLLVFVVTAYLYWHFVHKRRNLPPGPIPIPLFGNSHEILKEPPGETVFARWRKQYGDVYTYWMGSMPVVAVTDYKLIVETFQRDGETYAGRPKLNDFNKMIKGHSSGGGVFMTDGDEWRNQRRFALTVFRDFGLGKDLMQERVLEEVKTIFENVDADVASGLKEHDMYNHTDLAVGSIINNLLFGYRFHGKKKPEFADLKSRVQTFLTTMGHPLVFMSMPSPYFYKRLPFFKQKLEDCIETSEYLLDFYRERIQEHKKNFNIDEEPTDYVAAFLKEMNKKNNTNEHHYFTDRQLALMCFDLWIAGQETTSNSLAWAFAFMLHNLDVLNRCQKELDRVIGSDRIVTMSDKPNLHYCNATINEIQRYSSPKVPYNFNVSDPTERFLDNDRKLKKSEELIPFSIGKRICLGEGLARMELFLFFVNIINRYNLIPGRDLPNLTRKFGVTANIDRYTFKVEKR